eukprot:1181108-Prorocentrum_minimum.AAC.8
MVRRVTERYSAHLARTWHAESGVQAFRGGPGASTTRARTDQGRTVESLPGGAGAVRGGGGEQILPAAGGVCGAAGAPAPRTLPRGGGLPGVQEVSHANRRGDAYAAGVT